MKNKIISILCIFILISFSFINISFAASSFNTSYDYLYTYTVDNTFVYTSSEGKTVSIANLENYINSNLNDDRVVSGDYVYFIFQNYFASLSNVLVKKSAIERISLTHNLTRNDQNTISYNIYLSSSFNKSDVVWLNGKAEYTSNGLHHMTFYCDPNTKTLTTNFATNYDGDIYIDCSNGETKILEGLTIEPEIIYPAIQNTAEDLSTGTFEYIGVHPGTFSNTENIGLNIYDITGLEDNEDVYSKTPLFSTNLTSSSSYYKFITIDNVTEFWYEIPRSSLNINYKNDKTYLYCLLLDGSPIQEIQATIGGLTEEDILNNSLGNLQGSIVEGNKELQETITESNKELQSSIDKQTEAIEENNKTNKNIFEKIGDILSYINPFSENFFAYKLVELIVEGLKSLFVPGEDFFSTYFDELNSWFSDRLGFLYYPLELLFDLLDRFLNIDFAEPIINIPDIKEPFTNVTLIKSISFNFNDLLSNETLKNVHDIYFIIVDAVIYIGLVTLLYRKYEEVMTK